MLRVYIIYCVVAVFMSILAVTILADFGLFGPVEHYLIVPGIVVLPPPTT